MLNRTAVRVFPIELLLNESKSAGCERESERERVCVWKKYPFFLVYILVWTTNMRDTTPKINKTCATFQNGMLL